MHQLLKAIYGASKAFSPEDLFANGELGFWFDLAHPETVYQDIDGTVPAANLSDPIRLVKDRLENGHRLIRPSGTAPVLQTPFNRFRFTSSIARLELDAVDTFTGEAILASSGMVIHVSLDTGVANIFNNGNFTTANSGFTTFLGISRTLTVEEVGSVIAWLLDNGRISGSAGSSGNFIGCLPVTGVLSDTLAGLGKTVLDNIMGSIGTLAEFPNWDYTGITSAEQAFRDNGISQFNRSFPDLLSGRGLAQGNNITSVDPALLPALQDGRDAFQNNNIEVVSGTWANLVQGGSMFNGNPVNDISGAHFPELTSTAINQANGGMFQNTQVPSFSWSQFPKLSDGSQLFRNADLGATAIQGVVFVGLTTARGMFQDNSIETIESTEFPDLLNGRDMLFGNPLVNISGALFPVLTNGYGLFEGALLTSTGGVIFPELTDGSRMWHSTGVTSFDLADFPKLQVAAQMFGSSQVSSIANKTFAGVINAASMFIGAPLNDVTNASFPDATDCSGIFYGTLVTSATLNTASFPVNTNGRFMLRETPVTTVDPAIFGVPLSSGEEMFRGSDLEIFPDITFTVTANCNRICLNCAGLIEIEKESWQNQNKLSAFDGCGLLAILPANLNWGGGSLRSLHRNNAALVNYPAGAFNNITVSNMQDTFEGCTGLNQSAVDNILVSVAAGADNNNVNNGILHLTDSAAPSATGLAAVTDLQARGWTVTHN